VASTSALRSPSVLDGGALYRGSLCVKGHTCRSKAVIELCHPFHIHYHESLIYPNAVSFPFGLAQLRNEPTLCAPISCCGMSAHPFLPRIPTAQRRKCTDYASNIKFAGSPDEGQCGLHGARYRREAGQRNSQVWSVPLFYGIHIDAMLGLN
jgi:hypothetical protein